VTFADDAVDAAVSAAGNRRQILANGRLVFAMERIFPVEQARRLRKPDTLNFGHHCSIRRNAPTAGAAALQRHVVTVDVALGLVVVNSSRVESTLGLVPPAEAFFKDRGWRSDLQPVGTLLRAIAFVGRDAGLLPQLVLAMIKQLSRWTLTLLAGKYAVEIFAGEII